MRLTSRQDVGTISPYYCPSISGADIRDLPGPSARQRLRRRWNFWRIERMPHATDADFAAVAAHPFAKRPWATWGTAGGEAGRADTAG